MALYSGRTAVATPGTAVRLGQDITTAGPALDTVAITAFTDNADVVVIGASNVVASLSSRVGYPLAAGKTIVVGDKDSPIHPGDVWVDAINTGEGVTWLAM